MRGECVGGGAHALLARRFVRAATQLRELRPDAPLHFLPQRVALALVTQSPAYEVEVTGAEF